MRFIIVLLFIILFSNIAFSQKNDFEWIGGVEYYQDQSKVYGYTMSFKNNKGIPKANDIKYGFATNNTSLSDTDGNLLFYTNGCAILNKHHQVMLNGDSINAGEWFDKIWRNCLYGHPGPQDVLILNDPKYDQGYYMFHKTNVYAPNQFPGKRKLMYTYVDMSLDNGNGDVVVKNKNYYNDEFIMYSFFTAIKHTNKTDWWIVQPRTEDSTFLTFLLDKDGIKPPLKQNTQEFFDGYRSSAGGTAKFSPDGTKYALYTYTDQLHVYDFDRSTGILSNHQMIEIYNPDSINIEDVLFSSVEWSPNSRFVYCSSSNKLHQVDMWETNPQDGVRHIADYNGTLDPFTTRLFLMAQAPDCKIYMSPKNGSYSIHVINKPNELGQACDFVQNGIKLPAQNSGTLPNFPRFRVDEADKCDPTISSIFGEDVYYRRDIEIYPSPSYGVYQLRMPEGASDGHIVVTDIYGKIIYQTEINSYEHITEIDITSKPSGNYNIEYYPRINPERVFYGRQVVKI